MFSFCVLMRFGGVWLRELLELRGLLAAFHVTQRCAQPLCWLRE